MPKHEEDNEQIAFVQYVEHQYRNDPTFKADLFFHVLNGAWIAGKGNAKFALIAKYKAMGWKSGIADLHYEQPRGGFSKCVIEMKKKKGGVVSDNQKRYLDAIGKYAYVQVCNGYDEAKEAFDFYMKLESYEEVFLEKEG